MAGETVEDMLIRISVENKQLLAGVDQTNKKIDSLAAQATKAGNQGTSAFNNISGAVMRFAGPAVLGAAIVKFTQFTAQAIDAADKIGETASQLNLSTDAFQELGFAARQSGVEAQDFYMAFQTMNRIVGDAVRGNEQAKKKFHELGLQVEYLKTLNTDQMFEEIAGALSNVTSDSERATRAQELFGKAGNKVADMAKGGIENIKGLRQEARDLGIVLDAETIKKSEELKDQFDALKEAAGATFRNAILEMTLPTLEKLTNWLVTSRRAAQDLKAALKDTAELETIGDIDSAIRGVDAKIAGHRKFLSGDPSSVGMMDIGAQIRMEKIAAKELVELENKRNSLIVQRGYMQMAQAVEDQKQAQAKKALIDPVKRESAEGLEEFNLRDIESQRWSAEQAAMEWATLMQQSESVVALNHQIQDVLEQSGDAAEEALLGQLEVLPELVLTNKSAIQQMLEDWSKSSERMEGIFGQGLDQMSDALADFAMTGKLDVEDMTKSIIKNLIKIQLQALLVKALTGTSVGGAIANAMGFSAPSATPLATGTNYVPYDGMPAILHKGEAVVPAKYNPAAGGTPSQTNQPVRVEIVNKGSPAKVESATATQTPQGLITTVVLDDLKRRGPISQAMKGVR